MSFLIDSTEFYLFITLSTFLGLIFLNKSTFRKKKKGGGWFEDVDWLIELFNISALFFSYMVFLGLILATIYCILFVVNSSSEEFFNLVMSLTKLTFLLAIPLLIAGSKKIFVNKLSIREIVEKITPLFFILIIVNFFVIFYGNYSNSFTNILYNSFIIYYFIAAYVFYLIFGYYGIGFKKNFRENWKCYLFIIILIIVGCVFIFNKNTIEKTNSNLESYFCDGRGCSALWVDSYNYDKTVINDKIFDFHYYDKLIFNYSQNNVEYYGKPLRILFYDKEGNWLDVIENPEDKVETKNFTLYLDSEKKNIIVDMENEDFMSKLSSISILSWEKSSEKVKGLPQTFNQPSYMVDAYFVWLDRRNPEYVLHKFKDKEVIFDDFWVRIYHKENCSFTNLTNLQGFYQRVSYCEPTNCRLEKKGINLNFRFTNNNNILLSGNIKEGISNVSFELPVICD